MTEKAGRVVDHVVMPVETLGSARQLLDGLGFQLAPDAAHPFGTGNACVFLADGTYIEPLAVLDRDLAETEAANGNAFLRRDLAYRLRHPLPGLSGVALQSEDAFADKQAFARDGYDGGDILEFGRRFERPNGEAADLNFRLAFALDRASPETFLFACQRLFDVMPDRTALTTHRNRVQGLARLVYSAAEPETCRPFLEAVFGGSPLVSNSLGFSLRAANVAIDVLAPDGLGARYGETRGREKSLHLAGLVLRAERLDIVRERANAYGLACSDLLGRSIVHMPEPGAVFLAFEADAPRV